MIDETFVAPTPHEAYKEAIRKYGENNITLVSAKQIKYRDGEIYSEITVAISEKVFEEASHFTIDKDTKENNLQLEIEGLKLKLSLMQENKIEKRSVFDKIETLFMRQGISKEWLNIALTEIGENKDILENEISLVSYFLEKIDKSLKIFEENLDIPKVVMLVGATGVGKTTTVAKLAARYLYSLNKNYKIALVNLDNYKIGAHEQLSHYANVMEIEHIILRSVEEYEERLKNLIGYDLILIDTAGMSDIYNHFSFLNLDALIISKFDETKEFGTLLNFMLLYDIPMSYFCVGQEVPNDLILASKEYLLKKFIGDLDASKKL